MQELFSLCTSCGAGFKGGQNAPPAPHDDERLNRTIKSFTADYLSQQLLGVFSHTLALTLCIMLENSGLNVTGNYKHFIFVVLINCCVISGMVTLSWYKTTPYLNFILSNHT